MCRVLKGKTLILVNRFFFSYLGTNFPRVIFRHLNCDIVNLKAASFSFFNWLSSSFVNKFNTHIHLKYIDKKTTFFLPKIEKLENNIIGYN